MNNTYNQFIIDTISESYIDLADDVINKANRGSTNTTIISTYIDSVMESFRKEHDSVPDSVRQLTEETLTTLVDEIDDIEYDVSYFAEDYMINELDEIQNHDFDSELGIDFSQPLSSEDIQNVVDEYASTIQNYAFDESKHQSLEGFMGEFVGRGVRNALEEHNRSLTNDKTAELTIS